MELGQLNQYGIHLLNERTMMDYSRQHSLAEAAISFLEAIVDGISTPPRTVIVMNTENFPGNDQATAVIGVGYPLDGGRSLYLLQSPKIRHSDHKGMRVFVLPGPLETMAIDEIERIPRELRKKGTHSDPRIFNKLYDIVKQEMLAHQNTYKPL